MIPSECVFTDLWSECFSSVHHRKRPTFAPKERTTSSVRGCVVVERWHPLKRLHAAHWRSNHYQYKTRNPNRVLVNALHLPLHVYAYALDACCDFRVPSHRTSSRMRRPAHLYFEREDIAEVVQCLVSSCATND